MLCDAYLILDLRYKKIDFGGKHLYSNFFLALVDLRGGDAVGRWRRGGGCDQYQAQTEQLDGVCCVHVLSVHATDGGPSHT